MRCFAALAAVVLPALEACSNNAQRSISTVRAPEVEDEPAPTLDGILETSGELRDYVVVDSDPRLVIDEEETLWIRYDHQCSLISRDEDSWSHRLLLCETQGEPVIRCELEVTVEGSRFALSPIINCERSFLEGHGEGWFHPTNDMDLGRRDPELVAVTPDSYQFARIYRAWAMTSSVTIVEEPCLPGTREQAFVEHRERFPELTQEAVESAVLQTHSIYPNIEGRFCRRIDEWRIWVHEEGERHGCLGADEEHREGAVDCSRPCPETSVSQRMRAVGDLLRPLRLRRRSIDVTLFRSEEACLASGGVGLDIEGGADVCTASQEDGGQ